MPKATRRLCPGCHQPVQGRCPSCSPPARAATDHRRGTAAQRGYGWNWTSNIRPAYLRAHPLCALCGELAQVPDHHPLTRRELQAAGVDDLDAWHRLRPLCLACHARHGRKTDTNPRMGS